MRNESQMMALLLDISKKDDRIRAAFIEGSRANPEIKKDIFQDYDIVFIVNETEPFINDKGWTQKFGKPLYMQLPEESPFFPSNIKESYGWLIQFDDGVRLDLHVKTKDKALSEMNLYQVFLDKDGIFQKKENKDASIYYIKKPTEKEILSITNEFYWCLNNVAKGLWREEILYTMDMINYHVRPMLGKMLSFYIGIENDFSVSLGKSYKYMDKYLSEELYKRYLDTYKACDIKSIWQTVFDMCSLFEDVSTSVFKSLNVNYNKEEAINSLAFLKRVYSLPKDAKEIY